MIGKSFGHFEVVAKLGEGGMGEVYRALDTRLNRQVAIKVLPEPYASDPERVARFHREAQAVAALNHPGIAAIHELTEAPAEGSAKVKFLVLELVEGETLAERLRGAVPVEEALAIARQILEALEAAHERGICHRDLKPANIKLTGAGTGGEPPRVKVLDFGLAKFLQSGPASASAANSPTLSIAGTIPGVILGTAGYMSPEQARGFEADQRSDIFAFGCILFELLAGRQAFEGETTSDILAGVLRTDVDFALLPRRLNPRLAEVLKRCLEKNPKQRWHSAADVRVEIESVSGRALVADQPQPAGAVASRPLWQRAAALVAAALAGAALAGYLAWTLKPELPRPVTRFQLPLPEGQEFSNVGRQVVALSPDGRTLVYVASQRLYLRSLAALDTREIQGSLTPAGLLNPIFSPDGQSLAFYSRADRTLKRLPVTGGLPVTICPAEDPFGLSWGEGTLVFGQNSRGIVRVAETGGVPDVIAAAAGEELASNPQLLPGGRVVLFSVKKRDENWDKGSVVAQTLDGGARRVLVEGASDGRYLPTGHLVYARSGVVMAARFDVATLAIRGSEVPILEGISRGSMPGTGTGTMHVSLSASGSVAYVPGPATIGLSDGWDLAVFERKGTFQPLKLSRRPYQSPRVSPDGRWVAVDSVDDNEAAVWVMDMTGAAAERRLTFGDRSRAPVWSPDGQWIAYQSDREKDLAIFRQRADGAGAPERLTKPEADAAHVPESWSPDGSVLLFSESKAARYSLVSLMLKDRTAKPVTGMESSIASQAVFSPDGHWITYQVRGLSPVETGVAQSFVQSFPGGTKYLVPHAGGHPFWSLQGKELMLNAGPNQNVTIAVTTSPRLEFGQPVEFSRAPRVDSNPNQSRRNTDILPDGERVIGRVVTGSTGAVGLREGGIVVVVNWIDELRQRVP